MFIKGLKMFVKSVILFYGNLDVGLRRCLMSQINILLVHFIRV